jgi:hypothetical protein
VQAFAAAAAAAAAEEDMQAVREQLQCIICYDSMLDPVTAHCGHTFCKRCIVRWVRRAPPAGELGMRLTSPSCGADRAVGKLCCATGPVPVSLAIWPVFGPLNRITFCLRLVPAKTGSTTASHQPW